MAKERNREGNSETAEDVQPEKGRRSPKNAIAALKAPKSPPPESSKSIRIRRQVLASFWIVVILFGIPLWWWTTTVYKASLPVQDMLNWAGGRVGYGRLVRVLELIT